MPGLPVSETLSLAAVRDVAGEFRIDEMRTAGGSGLGRVVEEVEESLAHQHVLPQRHRPMLIDHHGGVAAHGLDPAAELFGVAHRRREAGQSHVFGKMQDDLLPHRPTHSVGEKVHLVHHHVGQALECIGTGVQHVAQHLGGHHHNRRVTVEGLIAGQQSDPFGTVARDQIVVLLIAQRLDRRGVKALLPGRQCKVDRELADDRLTRTGRSADQDAVTTLQRFAGLDLKRIQPELQVRGESG